MPIELNVAREWASGRAGGRNGRAFINFLFEQENKEKIIIAESHYREVRRERRPKRKGPR